jgi:hypothetical protein
LKSQQSREAGCFQITLIITIWIALFIKIPMVVLVATTSIEVICVIFRKAFSGIRDNLDREGGAIGIVRINKNQCPHTEYSRSTTRIIKAKLPSRSGWSYRVIGH